MEPYHAAERRRRDTRLALIGVAVGLVLLLVLSLGVWLVSRRVDHGPPTGTSAPRSFAAPTRTASPAAPATCLWLSGQGSANPNARDVGTPPPSPPAPARTTMTISTNRGVLRVRLDPAKTPCTVASFSYLASRHFFDNTSCHRLVTRGFFVLQCGDPSGTGLGGPGYTFPDENLTGIPSGVDGNSVYRRGVVALANGGPANNGASTGSITNGSQFFIVYRDSPLPPSYPPFGTLTAGLEVMDAVAAGGDDGAYGEFGGGHPKLNVVIQSLTMS
jgi:peptidyl-prolyl cis-trans isomerase B (cyclophilin B)